MCLSQIQPRSFPNFSSGTFFGRNIPEVSLVSALLSLTWTVSVVIWRRSDTNTSFVSPRDHAFNHRSEIWYSLFIIQILDRVSLTETWNPDFHAWNVF